LIAKRNYDLISWKATQYLALLPVLLDTLKRLTKPFGDLRGGLHGMTHKRLVEYATRMRDFATSFVTHVVSR